MKYELIPKEVLDEVCSRIFEVQTQIKAEKNDIAERVGIMLELERAYNSIQHNRTQCNVKPEGA